MVAELATRAATAVDNALLFRKIQDEDQRKNEFLAMLAHELRNPLAPISNAVHIMRVSADEPAKIAWARDVIARQLKQLVRLVDDLLDVSRITRGKIELKIDVVDVQQVVEAAIETSKPNIDGHRHTLSIQLPAETLHLRGDFARVSQILSNLINNAAKYTPRGGRISLSAARDDDAVVFRVRDSGVGIPPEYLVTIFEPFTQVDRRLRGRTVDWASVSRSYAGSSRCRAAPLSRAAKGAIAAASSPCACRWLRRSEPMRMPARRSNRLRPPDCACSSSMTIVTSPTARQA